MNSPVIVVKLSSFTWPDQRIREMLSCSHVFVKPCGVVDCYCYCSSSLLISLV